MPGSIARAIPQGTSATGQRLQARHEQGHRREVDQMADDQQDDVGRPVIGSLVMQRLAAGGTIARHLSLTSAAWKHTSIAAILTAWEVFTKAS